MSQYKGKSVIVTGGALGIGGGVSRAFANDGASVTIMDIDDDAGEALAAELTGQGKTAQYISADAGTIEGCRSTADAAIEAFGGIDILINNVGIQPPSSYVDAVDLPEEAWERIININLRSRFLMTKYSVPSMRQRGGGVIISVASVQGLLSMPFVSAYAASKGGDLSLTRQMSIDFAKDNIRVLAVNPGTINTPMVWNALQGTGDDLEQGLIDLRKNTPHRTHRRTRRHRKRNAIPSIRQSILHDRIIHKRRRRNDGRRRLGRNSRSRRQRLTPIPPPFRRKRGN